MDFSCKTLHRGESLCLLLTWDPREAGGSRQGGQAAGSHPVVQVKLQSHVLNVKSSWPHAWLRAPQHLCCSEDEKAHFLAGVNGMYLITTGRAQTNKDTQPHELSLLVAHPESRKKLWYKQENVTNGSMFQGLILKVFQTSPKIGMTLD